MRSLSPMKSMIYLVWVALAVPMECIEQADTDAVTLVQTLSMTEPVITANFTAATHGSQESKLQVIEPTSGWRASEHKLTTFFAILYVVMVAAVPLALYWVGGNEKPTETEIVEALVFYIWLFSGLYVFTNLISFQSGHFGEGVVRPCDLVEAIYFMSQCITTVGYGDVTPAYVPGEIFVGVYIIFSVLLMAGLIGQLAVHIIAAVETKIANRRHTIAAGYSSASPKNADGGMKESRPWKEALGPPTAAFSSLILYIAVAVFAFKQFPGEDKSYGVSVYMSLVTITTVGFGVYTPVTHDSMLFGAYFMLFGVALLGGFVGSFTACVATMKKWEKDRNEWESVKGLGEES